ncbi:MAG TPA: alpha/beta fold hydrolase [Candidatus Limnocylindrales bacterium]|nr:alpha/beta fold hydrolase [Candidatus Limnocylindrales bacterium]
MGRIVRTFEPHRWLRGGHAQTIGAAFAPRTFTVGAGEERLFRVDAETQLKGLCHWQEGKRRDLPVIVIVHGLEGSSDSSYAWGIADKACARGFHAVRMNQRNCGGTERLTPTLYNSGLSGDYRAVLGELIEEGFEKVFFAGYSMGGNLVTKMAGEFGQAAPRELKGIAAVCPALNLSACSDALEKRENALYQWHFVRGLMTRYRRKAELYPSRYARNGFGPIRTVREFDDAITAPCFGYKDAEEYYEAAGAKKVIGRVAVPMLLITAKDDPFVPYESFLRARVEENPLVRFLAPENGGHCGFISRYGGAERFWAEERIVEFVEEEGGKEARM